MQKKPLISENYKNDYFVVKCRGNKRLLNHRGLDHVRLLCVCGGGGGGGVRSHVGTQQVHQ